MQLHFQKSKIISQNQHYTKKRIEIIRFFDMLYLLKHCDQYATVETLESVIITFYLEIPRKFPVLR